jgi:hypothetical protein
VPNADRSHHRARDDRADARDRHQPLAALVLTSQHLDLAGETFDALIDAAPVCPQVLDEARLANLPRCLIGMEACVGCIISVASCGCLDTTFG